MALRYTQLTLVGRDRMQFAQLQRREFITPREFTATPIEKVSPTARHPRSERSPNMKPNPSSSGMNRRVLLSTLAVLPAFQPRAAMAQQAPLAAAFSFAVYGDSRPMMYLPYKEGQPELNQLFVE